jgi:hypothetical protein
VRARGARLSLPRAGSARAAGLCAVVRADVAAPAVRSAHRRSRCHQRARLRGRRCPPTRGPLLVPRVNPVVDSRAKIEHGQDAGSRNSSAIPASEDAARRRFAAAKRERICRRCHYTLALFQRGQTIAACLAAATRRARDQHRQRDAGRGGRRPDRGRRQLRQRQRHDRRAPAAGDRGPRRRWGQRGLAVARRPQAGADERGRRLVRGLVAGRRTRPGARSSRARAARSARSR